MHKEGFQFVEKGLEVGWVSVDANDWNDFDDKIDNCGISYQKKPPYQLSLRGFASIGNSGISY